MTDHKLKKDREAHIPNRRNEFGALKFPLGDFVYKELQEIQEKFRGLDIMCCLELIDYLAGMVYDEVNCRQIDRFDTFTEEDKGEVTGAMLLIQAHVYEMTNGPVHRYYNLD